MSGARLFVHSVDCRRLGVPGTAAEARRLARRAVMLAGPDDVVIADQPVDEAYLEFLRSIGIGPRRCWGAQGDGETVAARLLNDGALLKRLEGGFEALEPYAVDADIERLGRRLGCVLAGPPASLAERLNRKSGARALFEELGLPVAPGRAAAGDRAAEAARREFAQRGRLLVKDDRGLGGYGVHPVRDERDLEALAQRLSRNGARDRVYMVEQWLEAASSPNAQYKLAEGGIEKVGVADQVFVGEVRHVGNRALADAGAKQAADAVGWTIARRLHEDGYRGYVGIDFVCAPSGAVTPVEINARVNSSTYALAALSRIYGPDHGLDFEFQLRRRFPGVAGFRQWRDALGAERLMSPERRTGVLPFLWPDADGATADILAFGPSAEERAARLSEIARAFPDAP